MSQGLDLAFLAPFMLLHGLHGLLSAPLLHSPSRSWLDGRVGFQSGPLSGRLPIAATVRFSGQMPH